MKRDSVMSKTSLARIFHKPLSERLITAVKENDLVQLKALRKAGKAFNASDEHGNTLLHLALQHQVEGSMLKIFEYLLSLGGMPKNVANSFGRTPLMEAFGCRKNGEDYAILLIKARCNFRSTFPDGNTALHLATSNRWLHVAELLVEKGLDVDGLNSREETALHVAARVGCTDIAWMLLFFGADPNLAYTTYSGWSITTYTFFDVILANEHKEMQEAFFDESYGFDKRLSLMIFMEAMTFREARESEGPLFDRILDSTCDINYTYDDLKLFSTKIYSFKAKKFKLFIQKFEYVIEEMLTRCCLDGLFFCEQPNYIENYSLNFLALLESSAVHTLIDEVNSSRLPLLVHLIESFTIYRDVELLTQVMCGLLSYGAILTADAVNEIYFTFGYCELYKIVLHMDIQHISRCFSNRYVLPRITYDMSVDPNSVYSEDVCDDPIIYKISEFFTLAQMRSTVDEFQVPTLVELARNAARQYIITAFDARNSARFYTILRKLPIPELHKKIISFQTQLYES